MNNHNNVSIKHILPDNLRGRSITTKVIPTVCNLENMLDKLIALEGDPNSLKPWEKRCYRAYLIDDIKIKILSSTKEEWIDIIKNHILSRKPSDFGVHVIDIYLIAYVAETYGPGKDIFFKYIFDSEISTKENTANAIWQVGKGDGVFLNILHDNGKVKDWNFIVDWVETSRKK